MRSALIGSCLAFAVTASARDPAPVLLPSSRWRGVDGNWSTISFSIGSNSQQIDVLVSTALSEFWAVGSGGCLPKEPHCSTARGGIYEPHDSTGRESLGIWQLGLDYLQYGGNGEYGMDSVTSTSPIMDEPFTMSSTLVASINTTNYLNGYFGLGITQGNFGDKVAKSPLTDAVSTYGWIPSYSFGYTAGAHYRNAPVSLTLGGVDTTRYQDHSNDFTLTQGANMEDTLVRGIFMSSTQESEPTPSSLDDPPDEQSSSNSWLTTMDTSFVAVIDSTTPYLWFPADVCDEFANALNLTYDSTFDLYTLTNDQYRAFSRADAFNLTFALSSFDNTNDLGDPYKVSGVVNITIPARALVGLLEYPFMNESIGYTDPAVPYFMLRKAYDATYILGRSFLQETYLITKYDEGIFSIHQAKFPEAPFSEAGITTITQPDNSPYPPPLVSSSSSSSSPKKLTTGQIAGIGVGSGAFAALMAALVMWLCSKRENKKRAAKRANMSAQSNDTTLTLNKEPKKSPIARFFSLITGSRHAKDDTKDDQRNQQMSEAPNTQIYEMPAPIPPAELNGDDAASWNGDTELGTDHSNHISAYEIARRKMDRQLQGPVPAYTPPADGVMPHPEKTGVDNGHVNVQHRDLRPSPTSSTRSPRDGGSTGNLISLPSPITPRYMDQPSPMTATMPVSSADGTMSVPVSPFAVSSNSHSHDSNRLRSAHSDRDLSAFNHHPRGPTFPPIQRTPIDPSKVVFLGPLPGDARFRRQDSYPDTAANANREDARHQSINEDESYNSLGSNFTIDQERNQIDTTSMPHSEGQRRAFHTPVSGTLPSSQIPTGSTLSTTPSNQERINPSTELVHVPQMAERRYSWENDC